MKVWVVELCFPHEGCSLEGIFSTLEAAEAFSAKLVADAPYFRDDVEIQEHEVDAPARR
jgi:hypothetical protein